MLCSVSAILPNSLIQLENQVMSWIGCVGRRTAEISRVMEQELCQFTEFYHKVFPASSSGPGAADCSIVFVFFCFSLSSFTESRTHIYNINAIKSLQPEASILFC